MFSQAIGERLTPVMRWHASRAASSWPRAVGFGLTLSLAKLPPEAATRLGQTATFPIGLCLHGDGTRRLHTDVQRRPSASRRRFCILGHPHEARRPPDALLPDPAEQGWGRRPDNPNLLKGYEVISVVRGHGTILLPESVPSTRGVGRSTLPPSRCGAENGLAATGTPDQLPASNCPTTLTGGRWRPRDGGCRAWAVPWYARVRLSRARPGTAHGVPAR